MKTNTNDRLMGIRLPGTAVMILPASLDVRGWARLQGCRRWWPMVVDVGPCWSIRVVNRRGVGIVPGSYTTDMVPLTFVTCVHKAVINV